jgi:hypothetical protein
MKANLDSFETAVERYKEEEVSGLHGIFICVSGTSIFVNMLVSINTREIYHGVCQCVYTKNK